MRLDQLQHLIEIAKCKSLSIAATRLHISQPAISVSINKLEEYLGITLLRRSNQGISLTPLGEIVVEKAQEIIATIESIKQLNISSLTGSICIATIPGMCDRILPDVLSILKKQHPNLSIQLIIDESTIVSHHILSRKADLGIVWVTEEIQEHGIIIEELFCDEFLFYTSKDSSLATKPFITAEEFLQLPYMAYNDEFLQNKGGVTSLFKKHAYPTVNYRFDNFEIMKKFIADGLGFSLFPKIMSKNNYYLLSGRIIAIPVKDIDLSVNVGLIRSKRHRLTTCEKEFIKILKTMCEKTIAEESLMNN